MENNLPTYDLGALLTDFLRKKKKTEKLTKEKLANLMSISEATIYRAVKEKELSDEFLIGVIKATGTDFYDMLPEVIQNRINPKMYVNASETNLSVVNEPSEEYKTMPKTNKEEELNERINSLEQTVFWQQELIDSYKDLIKALKKDE